MTIPPGGSPRHGFRTPIRHRKRCSAPRPERLEDRCLPPCVQDDLNDRSFESTRWMTGGPGGVAEWNQQAEIEGRGGLSTPEQVDPAGVSSWPPIPSNSRRADPAALLGGCRARLPGRAFTGQSTNLQLTNVLLVDRFNNPITAPVVGEMVFVRAECGAGPPDGAGDFYFVRFGVDGVASNSSGIGGSPGTGLGYYWWLGGWFCVAGHAHGHGHGRRGQRRCRGERGGQHGPVHVLAGRPDDPPEQVRHARRREPVRRLGDRQLPRRRPPSGRAKERLPGGASSTTAMTPLISSAQLLADG